MTVLALAISGAVALVVSPASAATPGKGTITGAITTWNNVTPSPDADFGVEVYRWDGVSAFVRLESFGVGATYSRDFDPGYYYLKTLTGSPKYTPTYSGGVPVAPTTIDAAGVIHVTMGSTTTADLLFARAPHGIVHVTPSTFDARALPEGSAKNYLRTYRWDAKTNGGAFVATEVEPFFSYSQPNEWALTPGTYYATGVVDDLTLKVPAFSNGAQAAPTTVDGPGTFTIVDGQTTPITLNFARGSFGTVTGTVVSKGQPVADVIVGNQRGDSVKTGADGTFSIATEVGSQALTFAKNPDLQPIEKVVQVTDGQVTPLGVVTMVSTAPATVHGVLTKADGSPCAGQSVMRIDSSWKTPTLINTDATGAWTYSGSVDESIRLSVTGCGAITWYSATGPVANESAATRLVLTGNQEVNIRALAKPVITGVVRDKAGNPQPRVKVQPMTWVPETPVGALAGPVPPPPGAPTDVPSLPSGFPTALPTGLPTALPTAVPTGVPTDLPSGLPTAPPTALPTALPTAPPKGTWQELPNSAVTTNERGEYRLEVPSGSYALRVDPWATSMLLTDVGWYGGPQAPADPTAPGVVDLTSAATKTADIALPDALTATGRVVSSTGRPPNTPIDRVIMFSRKADGSWAIPDEQPIAADGTYVARVRRNTKATVAFRARWHNDTVLGGGSALPESFTDANSFTVAESSITLPETTVKYWRTLPKFGDGAVSAAPYCTANTATGALTKITLPDTLQFRFGGGAPRSALYLSSQGTLEFADATGNAPTAASKTLTAERPVIAPLGTAIKQGSGAITWGFNQREDTFCATWRSVAAPDQGGYNTFQVVITATPPVDGRRRGDADITFNYDEVTYAGYGSEVTAIAGFSDGKSRLEQLPGSGSSSMTDLDTRDALIKIGGGSQTPQGRKTWHYEAPGGGTLTGKIALTGGGNSGGYEVTACATHCYSDVVAVDGSYRLAGIAPGAYTLSVAARPEVTSVNFNSVRTYAPGARTTVHTGTATHTVADGQTVTVPELSVTPPSAQATGNGIVTGRLTWPDGTPAAGVSLSVLGSPVALCGAATGPCADDSKTTYKYTRGFSSYTDDDGRFVVTGVEGAGLLYRRGLALPLPATQSGVYDTETRTIPREPNTVTGRVLDAQGAPISNATISVSGVGVFYGDHARTDERGVFVMPAWTAPGSLRISAPGKAVTAIDLVKSNPPTHIDAGTTTLFDVAATSANVGMRTVDGSLLGLQPGPVPFISDKAGAVSVIGCGGMKDRTFSLVTSDGTVLINNQPLHQLRDGRGPYYGLLEGVKATVLTTAKLTSNVPATCAVGAPTVSTVVYIDPSGYITDQYGRTIDGAVATLRRKNDAGDYVPVPDGSEVMSPANRTNPMTTQDGFFKWDVADGWYDVKAEAAGCTTTTTPGMSVPPERLDLLIKMECTLPAPTAMTAPTLTGDPVVGSTLTATAGTWLSPLTSAKVEILRNGVSTGGSTYVVKAEDVGAVFTAQDTGKRPDYAQEYGKGGAVTFTPVTAVSTALTGKAAPATTPSTTAATSGPQGNPSSPPKAAPTGTTGAATNGTRPAAAPSAAAKPAPPAPAPAAQPPSSKAAPTVTVLKAGKATAGKLTLSVTVSGTSAGTVVLYDGTRKLGSVSLKAGKATYKAKGIKKGKHKFSAVFVASPTAAASQSKTVSVTVS